MNCSVRFGGLLAHVMKRPLTVIGVVVGVSAGYYLGCLLGLMLRLPPATPSVLWPPNAFLTAILLLVPPRRWPLVLLAALPAHLAVELSEWPTALVFALFLTNCSEAVLTAGPIWAFSDAPRRFDTPRRLAIFFLAVLGATALSSFADAAAVRWFVGEPYWVVWRNRFLSNVLAELTIVPAIVGVATVLTSQGIRTFSAARLAEAALVGAGLLATGVADFRAEMSPFRPLTDVLSQTPLALQLPFLLWAAVRFGTAGAGVTLFATA